MKSWSPQIRTTWLFLMPSCNMIFWKSSIYALFLGLRLSASLALPESLLDGQLITLSYTSKSSDSTKISTPSVMPNNSDDNALKVACNGRRFGTPLNLESCRNAIRDVIPHDKDNSFGKRFPEHVSPFDCPLPWRWLSSQYSISMTRLDEISRGRIEYAYLYHSGRILQRSSLSHSSCFKSSCKHKKDQTSCTSCI